jgi:hypothetical protein
MERLAMIEKIEDILIAVITGLLPFNGVLINITHILIYLSKDKNENAPLCLLVKFLTLQLSKYSEKYLFYLEPLLKDEAHCQSIQTMAIIKRGLIIE